MKVDYGYLLLTGFKNGYFSINSFPKCERFFILRELEKLQETEYVETCLNDGDVLTLTSKGEQHYQSFKNGIPVAFPEIPFREDRSTRKRAEIIARLYSL